MTHGLDPHHLAIIRDILHPYAHNITRAIIFGSRATGTWHPSSDLDLALYGPVTEQDVGRIAVAFSESLLPFTVDLVRYDCISNPALKAHIDRVGIILGPLA